MAIAIDVEGVDAIKQELALTERQYAKILPGAVRKTATQVHRRALRVTGDITGIPVRRLRRRIFRFKKGRSAARVWLGVNVVPAHWVKGVKPERGEFWIRLANGLRILVHRPPPSRRLVLATRTLETAELNSAMDKVAEDGRETLLRELEQETVKL